MTGIAWVSIRVKDVMKAVDFYTSKLGMRLTVNDPENEHFEVSFAGSKTPSILLLEDHNSTGEDTGVTFSTDDIQATCKMLEENGVRVTKPYKAHREWWAGFKDLDGNSYGLNQK